MQIRIIVHKVYLRYSETSHFRYTLKYDVFINQRNGIFADVVSHVVISHFSFTFHISASRYLLANKGEIPSF